MPRPLHHLSAILLIGSPAPALAGEVVVLESHSASVTNQVEMVSATRRLVQNIHREFHTRGLVMGMGEVRARIEERVSRPGRLLAPEVIFRLKNRVEEGVRNYQHGRFQAAVQILAAALNVYDDALATLAQNRQVRQSYTQNLIYLAMSQSLLGHKREATRLMARLIRYFPELKLSRVDHGEKPRALYLRVRKLLNKQTRGSLRVRVNDPNVIIFLNGRFDGTGNQVFNDLYPGEHFVYVQRGREPGRIHVVTIQSGHRSDLDISWTLDHVLRTQEVVGFAFEDEQTRTEKEAEVAGRVARGINADGIILLSRQVIDGRMYLLGSRLSLDTNQVYARGALALQPEPELSRIKALVEHLASPVAASGVTSVSSSKVDIAFFDVQTEVRRSISESEPVDVPLRVEEISHRAPNHWRWGLVSAGAGAVAAGVVFLALNNPGQDCSEITMNPEDQGDICEVGVARALRNPRDTAMTGTILVAGGAGMAALGGILLLPVWGGEESKNVSIAPVGEGAWGLIATGQF